MSLTEKVLCQSQKPGCQLKNTRVYFVWRLWVDTIYHTWKNSLLLTWIYHGCYTHQNAVQSKCTISHLLGLNANECILSMPSVKRLNSGQMKALPAYAASTCNQMERFSPWTQKRNNIDKLFHFVMTQYRVGVLNIWPVGQNRAARHFHQTHNLNMAYPWHSALFLFSLTLENEKKTPENLCSSVRQVCVFGFDKFLDPCWCQILITI